MTEENCLLRWQLTATFKTFCKISTDFSISKFWYKKFWGKRFLFEILKSNFIILNLNCLRTKERHNYYLCWFTYVIIDISKFKNNKFCRTGGPRGFGPPWLIKINKKYNTKHVATYKFFGPPRIFSEYAPVAGKKTFWLKKWF